MRSVGKLQLVLASILVINAVCAIAAQPKQPLPTVILIGDSIREGYAPLVAKALVGKATVVSSEKFGQNSAEILAHLDLVISAQPDVVDFNCGLRDLARSKQTGQATVTLEQYERNLKKIVTQLRKETSAKIVFATITPVIDARHAKRQVDYDRTNADVRSYNEAALRVMKDEGIDIDDVNQVVTRRGLEKLIGDDGVHYQGPGNAVVAEAVSECLLQQLTARDGK